MNNGNHDHHNGYSGYNGYNGDSGDSGYDSYGENSQYNGYNRNNGQNAYNTARNDGYDRNNISRQPEGYRRSPSRQPDEYRRSSSRQPDGYPRSDGSRRVQTSRSASPAKEDEKMPIMFYVGIAVTAVAIIALIISISVNSSRSKRHRSVYEDDLPTESDVVDDSIADEPDGDFEVVDDPVSSGIHVQSFEGTWYKADVDAPKKAVFSVSMQFDDSFEFRLEIWNGSQSAVISDTAFYTDETHAEYSPKKKVSLTFERGAGCVIITHKGKNSDFKIGSDFVIDGKFTLDEPAYAVESEAGSPYDGSLYQSEAVQNALAETLSPKDYALYREMMENGLKSPIDYERTTDKYGNLVNVDSELNAVKYYAHLSNGYDMIFICSDKADIYLLFYNSEEIIYCTNDRNYYKKMPKAFQAVADAKNIKPTFR